MNDIPDKTPKNWLPLLVFSLLILNVALGYLEFSRASVGLRFAVLNVGQGDALFIESPTGTQILVDGGPSDRTAGELARLLSPFDRHIDAIIITNPDQDHLGGFNEVLARYKVDMVFEPGTHNDSRAYQNLKDEIKQRNITELLARDGMRLKLGGGAVLDILFPDRDVSGWSPNEGSVVAKLTYGATSFMLTGDSTIKTERIVLENYPPSALDVDVLKVGHHGSKTSSAYNFLEALTPKYAIISAGTDNRYGHPHAEVLRDLEALGAKILRTDTDGTITFNCDRIKPCEIKTYSN